MLDEFIYCSISLAKMATFGGAEKYQARMEQLTKLSIGDGCRDDIEHYWTKTKVLEVIKPENIRAVVLASGIAAKKQTKLKKEAQEANIARNIKPGAFGRSDLNGALAMPATKKFKRIGGRCDADTKQTKCRREKTCKFQHPWAESMRELFANE